MSKVAQSIVKYMNSASKKEFTVLEVLAIRNSIALERKDRQAKKIKINPYTNKGKEIINRRVAEIANKKLGNNKLTFRDIKLLKRAQIDEFQIETGKCIWGLAEERKRLGFDPQTGYELI